jgi:serine/threonine protein phosphatase PrpC
VAEVVDPGGDSGDSGDSGNGRIDQSAVLAKLSYGLCSDPGPTRHHNEDFAGAYALNTPDDAWERGPVFAVADGMGGHAAGEIASRLAIDCLLTAWSRGTGANAGPALRGAARAANAAVYDSSMHGGPRGMGTTLTAVALAGREAVVVHVGDSRAYLVRHGTASQLTADHSRVGEMLRMKLLSPEQAARHPARSQLTRSLGTDPLVQVDVVRQRIERGDGLVLCSDGLWDEVSMQEIAQVVGAVGEPDVPTAGRAAQALVELAVKREAADNVTAVVVCLTSDQPIPPAGTRRSIFRRGGR